MCGDESEQLFVASIEEDTIMPPIDENQNTYDDTKLLYLKQNFNTC